MFMCSSIVKEFVATVKRERCKKERENLVYPNFIDFFQTENKASLENAIFFSNLATINNFSLKPFFIKKKEQKSQFFKKDIIIQSA